MRHGGRWVVALGVLAAAATAGVATVLDSLDSPGPQPEGLASDGTHLWVADFVTGLIYRVDTSLHTVVQTYAAPGPNPEGLAWDGTHLWCADWTTRKIYRLSVGESELGIDRELPTPMPGDVVPHPVGLTWDGESLWLTTWQPYYLFRLNPETGDTLRARRMEGLYPVVAPSPEDLAWDGSHLWITDWYTGEIHRIEPDSLVVTRTIASGGPRSVGLAFHLGYLWNGDTEETSLYRLDVTDGTVPVIPTTWGRVKRLGLAHSPR